MSNIISSAFLYVLLVGNVTALLLFSFASPISMFILGSDGTVYIRWLSIAVPAGLCTLLTKQIFFGLLKVPKAYMMENIDSVLRLVFIFIAVYIFSQGLTALIIAYTLGSIITAAVGIAMVKKFLQLYRWRLSQTRELLSYSWPVSVSEIATALQGLILIIILKNTNGSSEVGRYAAAVSIASLLHLVPQIIMPVFFPVISKSYGRQEEIQHIYRATISGLSAVLMPACAILIGFAQVLIIAIFGEEYRNAIGILQILAVAYTWYAVIIWPNRMILDMAGLTKTNMFITLIRACFMISITVLLAPYFGGMGLALALTTGWIIEGLLCLMVVKREKFFTQ